MSEPVARSIKDFCQAYGVSRSEVYRLLAAKKLRAVKLGTRTRILEDSARQWLASLPPAKVSA